MEIPGELRDIADDIEEVISEKKANKERLESLEESIMHLRALVHDADVTVAFLMLQKRTTELEGDAKRGCEVIDLATDELLYRTARVVDFMFSDEALKEV